MSEPLLEVDGLSVSFLVEGTSLPVLRDLSFTVGEREVLALVGESGSGKSTALLAIMNYLANNARVDAGRTLFEGRDMLVMTRPELDRVRGRRVAMVYQDPGTAFNPSMTIGAQITEAVRRHLRLGEAAARARALDWLDRVHLEEPRRINDAYPHQLSGGQKQRAMIALALCCEPCLLLMDEPTTALDVVVQARILALIRELCRATGTGIVFVTHDLGAAAQVADRVAVLYAGDLMEIGAESEVLHQRRNPYTRGLVAALPRLRDRALPHAIRGTISRDPDRFARCVFAGRCPATAPLCNERRPGLAQVAPGWHSRCHFAREPERLTVADGDEIEVLAIPATTCGAPFLEVRDLHVTYRPGVSLLDLIGGRGRGVEAVRGISFMLPAERTVAVVGESGSGKTTLARAVLNLVPAAAGEILVEGRRLADLSGPELRAYRRSVQIVFQNPTSSLNPRKTVAALVARPLLLAGTPRRAAQEAARRVLAEVGLDEGYLGRFPAELSGGEKQRVAIARAFVTEPRLVILDEPTTALDVSVQATVLRLLARLRAEHHCSYLLISHDLAVVRQLADEVIVMRAGEVCEAGSAETVFASPRHAYTRDLLASVPTIEAAA